MQSEVSCVMERRQRDGGKQPDSQLLCTEAFKHYHSDFEGDTLMDPQPVQFGEQIWDIVVLIGVKN
jgi:hypothetical protein